MYEIITSNTTDSDARETIERQLAISAKVSQELGVDDAIADMALVGSDLFFNDGAGVGVLFQASDHARLSEIIDNQRQASLRSDGNVQQRDVQIKGRSVPLLIAPGNAVRSYYVVDGDFHLVTNSRDIAAKFIESGRARNGLGHLNEFRYARTKEPLSRDGRNWIYLSDPFFRRLVSPSYRIEMGRRARALAELQELRLAALAAASEGDRDASVERLKKEGFLSFAFGKRSDDSRPKLVKGSAVDSRRGTPGTFLPIADMTIAKATRGEVVEYADFRRRYARQWRAMDPVVASFASAGPDLGDRERISIRILVTPYARERYRSLVSCLAPASSRRIARLPDDLLSVEAGLHSGTGTRQVHIGLQDAEVPFEIRGGEIVRHAPFEHSTFASRNFYAVVNPPGTAGLHLIRRFRQSLEGTSPDVIASTSLGTTRVNRTARRAPESPLSLGPVLGPLVLAMEYAVSKTPKLLQAMLVSSAVEQRGPWTVMARSADTRSHALPQLGFEQLASPAQVRFRMRDANTARVAPYIHAFTFLASRKSSAANAQLFNLLHQQLNVRPRAAQSTAKSVFRTRFVCPLGGTYRLAADATTPAWRSSAWKTESYYDLTEAPRDYQFPFLQWLRNLDVAFQLSPTTLTADIELEVQRPVGARLVPEPLATEEGSTKQRSAPTKSSESSIQPVRDRRQLQAGDWVVTLDEAVKLRLDRTTLARLSRGESLKVLETRRSWIGVQRTEEKQMLRGWVQWRDLGTITERPKVAENDGLTAIP